MLNVCQQSKTCVPRCYVEKAAYMLYKSYRYDPVDSNAQRDMCVVAYITVSLRRCNKCKNPLSRLICVTIFIKLFIIHGSDVKCM